MNDETAVAIWKKVPWVHLFPSLWGGELQLHSVINTIRNGPQPKHESIARSNEQLLGISPPCVYFYLGRGELNFGECAIAITFDSISGSASPFDTGGIIKYTEPLLGWKDEERKEFLRQYTWDLTKGTEFVDSLSLYPGYATESIRAYMRGARPGFAGPHVLRPDSMQANIWQDNSHPKAWTWEGRCPKSLPPEFELFGWACPPHLYSKIRERFERAQNETEYSLFKSIDSKYVDHGVTGLMQHLSNTLGAP